MKRKEYRQRRIEQYFDLALKDIRVKFPLKLLRIYTAKEAMSQGISSIGSTQSEFREHLIQITSPYTGLTRGSVLAVYLPTPESITAEAAAAAAGQPISPSIYTKSNIAGYLLVVNVDIDTEMMHVIAPLPCRGVQDLPSNALFLGKIKFAFE